MSIRTAAALLDDLLHATRPSEVQAILAEIGDRPDLAVDQSFGPLNTCWHFVGDNPSNMSVINLASKPARSLTERITNGIDAMLERAHHAHQNAGEVDSPMAGAEAWFGRPPTTVSSGLYEMPQDRLEKLADLIQVVLMPGDETGKPAVDVLDRGIGIQPDEFDQTILSFHQGNKISKQYLAGAFGQGGSSTIAFSDYTLIVSRHVEHGDTLGFTVVKQMELGEGYKENAYVYLASVTEDGSLSVPCIRYDGKVDLYPGIEDPANKPYPMKNGTLVRHYAYQLGALDRPFSTSPGNLLHMLEYMLFDPVLPLRLVDLRTPGEISSVIVIGSRNRLMQPQEEVEVRHHQPKFWVRPLSSEAPSLGVEYWVVFASLRQNGHKPAQRARPNDLFLDPAHPLIGTMNGQNHGELTARIIRDARLPQVARHLVVHLDLSQVSKRVRSQLLSSTREGFKDGEPLDEIVRVLKDHFRDDERLQAIEMELQAMLLADTSHASAEVKRQITWLLRDVGLDYGDYGRLPTPGRERRSDGNSEPRAHRLQAHMPLMTQPYPQAGQLKIVNPREVLRIHQGDSRAIRVETDADSFFDHLGALRIQIEPEHLVDIAKGALVGGRIQWRLRPRKDTQPGDFGEVSVTLDLPDGQQLMDHIPYEILPPREAGIQTTRGLVPQFDVQGLDPDESPEHFFRIWDHLDPEKADLSGVAYKVVETGSSIVVYYSKAFGPYRKRWDAIMAKQPTLASQFVQNYEIWIGYYAILQWQQRMMDQDNALAQVDEGLLDRLIDRESALVAEVQAKQALTVADLQRRFTDLV